MEQVLDISQGRALTLSGGALAEGVSIGGGTVLEHCCPRRYGNGAFFVPSMPMYLGTWKRCARMTSLVVCMSCHLHWTLYGGISDFVDVLGMDIE